MRRHLSQQGMALVAALFLIVVLGGLGLFAVRIHTSQQQSLDLALLGSRAAAAANSGLEYAANRALMAGVCAGAITLNLSQGALTGYQVQVSCTQSSHINNLTGVPTLVYRLDAFAQHGVYGTPTYVSRRAIRMVSKP